VAKQFFGVRLPTAGDPCGAKIREQQRHGDNSQNAQVRRVHKQENSRRQKVDEAIEQDDCCREGVGFAHADATGVTQQKNKNADARPIGGYRQKEKSDTIPTIMHTQKPVPRDSRRQRHFGSMASTGF
jgi:hypothetical protein